MQDLKELAAWYAARTTDFHFSGPVTSLPEPVFTQDGRTLVSFSTNNYLALATSARMKARAHEALEKYGVGNCESRLLGGNLAIYDELEAKLAAIKQKETALLFATGFLTNIGVLPALVRMGQMARAAGYTPRVPWKHAFFSDEFNHLSIREGIRASGAPLNSFRHLDMNDLEEKLARSTANVRIIVTDGVFSQHGDIAPLPEIMQLADRFDAAVYIDDAHGTGVLGATGGGITEHFGIRSPRIINMGTLSKAYGAIGGFVATEHYMAALLRAGCAAYGFTSTIPPDQAAALLEAIDMVINEPERRQRLWDNQRYFIEAMGAAGLSVTCTDTPILPFHVGDENDCLRIAGGLEAAGYHVDAITFPAIPLGQSRLRFMMNAGHTREQIDGAVGALAHLSRELHVAPIA